MIDWLNLGFNSLWIIACALALAVFSYSSYLASENNVRLGVILQQKAPQAWFSLAGALFCIGLAGTSGNLIYLVVWAVLAVLFLVQLFVNLRSKN